MNGSVSKLSVVVLISILLVSCGQSSNTSEDNSTKGTSPLVKKVEKRDIEKFFIIDPLLEKYDSILIFSRVEFENIKLFSYNLEKLLNSKEYIFFKGGITDIYETDNQLISEFVVPLSETPFLDVRRIVLKLITPLEEVEELIKSPPSYDGFMDDITFESNSFIVCKNLKVTNKNNPKTFRKLDEGDEYTQSKETFFVEGELVTLDYKRKINPDTMERLKKL